MFRFALIGLLFCLLWPAASQAEELAGQPETAIAVMPFTKLSGDRTVWLDKAIADLVAQKLSESDHYAVMNRDVLQTFLKEMQFQESGFIDDSQTITSVGKIAKVDQVVYGNYTLEGSTLAIHLMVMDVATQKLINQQDISGAKQDVITLSAQLVGKLFSSKNISLSEQEKANIAFKPTNSISAIEHFYTGLHAYDSGDIETAMGEFYSATQQDIHYLDAQLWFAHMLEQLDQKDQAIIAYNKLYDTVPQSVEGIDARYFAARLQEKHDPGAALSAYQDLVTIHPEIPESLEAAYRQAALYRKQGDSEKAYALYKVIDDFGEKARKHEVTFQREIKREETLFSQTWPNRLSQLLHLNEKADKPHEPDTTTMVYNNGLTRHSRFFDWSHALGLYREANVAMVELYRDLPVNAEGKINYPPPRGSFVVDPEHPIISGDVKEKDKSLFGGDHTMDSRWSEMFYAVIIPKGYKAVGAKLQITGNLAVPSETHDFTLRVLPFPLPQSYQTNWLGAIYGQTSATTTLTKEVPFFGNDQKLLTLQLVENFGKIDHWQVEAILRKDNGEIPSTSLAVSSDIEGALLAKVRLGNNDSHTIQSMPQFILQNQPKQKLAIADNFDHGLWLVGVKGELYGDETNLWISHSEDAGKRWSQSEPMTINSASMEFAPTLVRAEDASLQLFFLSNRRGLGWELWTSRQDPKTNQWSHPRLVLINELAPSGFEDGKNLGEQLLPYSVTQDNTGRWLVATYSKTSQKTSFLISNDLEQWSLLSSENLGEVRALGVGQDASGKYYLASVNHAGDIEIRQSNDVKNWQSTTVVNKHYITPIAAAVYPLTWVKRGNQGMTLLFSDLYTGLQYVAIAPGDRNALPDLVTNTGLEPYAVAFSGSYGFTAALWKDDNIHLQHYKQFAFAENTHNKLDEIIYTERSNDHSGGVWDRIFARERYRVPDVTAVGTAPEGRVWWGIETGAMSLKGMEFFNTDVSMGFFYHYVDTIKNCGDTTWFVSSELETPKVGYSKGNPNVSSTTRSLTLSELSGAITAIACGNNGETYFADGKGNILLYPQEGERRLYHEPSNASITALAFDDKRHDLIAGTLDGTVFTMDKNGNFSKLYALPNHKINALAVDAESNTWLATESGGIVALDKNRKPIKTYDANSSTLSHVNIKKMMADPKSGIWAMGDRYSRSQGLMHIDMHDITLHNPPQKMLGDVLDFDIADDKSFWLGTNLDGIYHYMRKR